jgi:hypothetical protein
MSLYINLCSLPLLSSLAAWVSCRCAGSQTAKVSCLAIHRRRCFSFASKFAGSCSMYSLQPLAGHFSRPLAGHFAVSPCRSFGFALAGQPGIPPALTSSITLVPLLLLLLHQRALTPKALKLLLLLLHQRALTPSAAAVAASACTDTLCCCCCCISVH